MLAAGLAAFAGLNPCFNGRYSQRMDEEIDNNYLRVLILVLMEDTLRDMETITIKTTGWSLNPCFNGRYSQRSKIQKTIKVES